MEEFIRNQLLTLYSSRIIGEFKTFIWNNNRAQAMRSYNDDLIMAFAIACWVKDTALTVNQRDMEYKKAMVNSIKLSNNNFQTTIPGMTGHQTGPLSKDAVKIRKQYEDFIWLIKG
jgi:hypothetical protein